MGESEFEGTRVLEKLAEVGMVDDFFEAIDSDDFKRSRQLMEQADLDGETIAIVLEKMKDADSEH